MEPVEIKKYLDMAVRRKYWVMIPFLVTLLIGLGYALTKSKIYESKTLILVQPQRVPQSYVQPIVTADIEDRLRTISQQVTSRTNLESIIKKYGLYGDKEMIMETKVAGVRKRILLNVVSKGGRGGSSFEIAFRDSIPRRSMEIANALASNFISENLKMREAQAIGTSDFLSDELQSVRKRLAEKEEQLKIYREKYMGAMPEHLNTNLRILDRIQNEINELNKTLRDAENRKLIIQQQMTQTQMMSTQMTNLQGSGSLIEYDDTSESQGFGSGELEALRKQLKMLETRYTENHPDVRRVREMINKLEAEEAESEEAEPETEPIQEDPMAELSLGGNLFEPQLDQINAEIRRLKVEIEKAQAQIKIHRIRVEETPKREQELLGINRDYLNLKELYKSLLDRKLEAELALNMEKKQKGEQFRVIDPARLPEKPVEPDLRKILLFVLVLGLGLGGGLAYGVEFLDTSYRNPEDVEKELQIPVLVSMPIRYTEGEIKGRKRKSILVAFSIASGFFLSAAGIVVAAKGVDGTVQYVRNLLNSM